MTTRKNIPTVHILVTPTIKVEKRRRKCPNCKFLRMFLLEHYEWYSPMWTCLHCGDRWSDGEQLLRPFCRGWRQERIKEAKAQWARHQKGMK